MQRVNCSGEVGVFSLSFRDGATKELPYYASARELEEALKATAWWVGTSLACLLGPGVGGGRDNTEVHARLVVCEVHTHDQGHVATDG